MGRPKKELAQACELPTPVHCNGNIICAIDTETTGLEAGFNDLVQIAIVVLDENFKPNKSVPFFYTDLKPLRPDNAEARAFQVNGLSLARLINDGLDPFAAVELFIKWFEDLNLGEGKRILPLGHNYDFDKGFLKAWLGPKNYDYMFHYEVRDSKQAVAFLTDKQWWKADELQFSKTSLTYVAGQLGIPTDRSHDALGDAITTAEVWRRLLTGVPV